MNRLEDALREALRRREPSAGFTERVMARVAEPAAQRRLRFLPAFGIHRWPWSVAVAAACVLMLLGIEHRRAERARVEEARRQVITALRVTGEALDLVREQVRKSIHLSPGILNASKERI